MSIVYTASFTLDQLTGVHDFSADTIKMALFTTDAALSSATTAYSTTNELGSGNGYTAGGVTMVVSSGYPALESGRASVRFDTVSWTFTANKTLRYGLIYNSSRSDKSIAVFDFSGSRTYTGSFSVSFPLTQPALIMATSGS